MPSPGEQFSLDFLCADELLGETRSPAYIQVWTEQPLYNGHWYLMSMCYGYLSTWSKPWLESAIIAPVVLASPAHGQSSRQSQLFVSYGRSARLTSTALIQSFVSPESLIDNTAVQKYSHLFLIERETVTRVKGGLQKGPSAAHRISWDDVYKGFALDAWDTQHWPPSLCTFVTTRAMVSIYMYFSITQASWYKYVLLLLLSSLFLCADGKKCSNVEFCCSTAASRRWFPALSWRQDLFCARKTSPRDLYCWHARWGEWEKLANKCLEQHTLSGSANDCKVYCRVRRLIIKFMCHSFVLRRCSYSLLSLHLVFWLALGTVGNLKVVAPSTLRDKNIELNIPFKLAPCPFGFKNPALFNASLPPEDAVGYHGWWVFI